MKKTKRLAVALAGLLGLTLVAGQVMAQTGEPAQGKTKMMHRGEGMGQPDPARHLQHLTTKLGLTSEQQEKIKPILDEEAAQLKAIDNEKLTRAERRTRMQELHGATFEKIRPILTPEQQKKHDAMREQMKDRRDHRMKPTEAPAK
jgi:Spy/CpxP family protein refolding chaperone